jgi:tetratricopeptide (TPR) repeat protein
MKYLPFFFMILGLPLLVRAQEEVASKLPGTWVAKRIENRDAEPIMSDEEVRRSDVVFIFTRNQLTFYINQRRTVVTYTLNGNRLRTTRGVTYTIEKLTEFELQLTETTQGVPYEEQVRFVCARTDYADYADYIRQEYVRPAARFDGDTFYVMNERVHPVFTYRLLDSSFFETYQNSYTFIEEAFRQAARPRRDRFRVSFIVTPRGAIEDIAIAESTDTTMNGYLRSAIRSTQGRWLPAQVDGKAVRAQVNYEFPFGLPEDQTLTVQQINALKAKDLFPVGLRNFNRKEYAQALEVFSRGLELDPTNVSIRLNRAATYFQLDRTPEACTDWQLLQQAGEKSVDRLIRRYCKPAAAAPPSRVQ